MEAPLPAQTPEDISFIDFKEFPNLLNQYYLKVGYNKDNKLILICYNIILLDNIRYEAKISKTELYQLTSAFRTFQNISQIYDAILQIINNGNFEIVKEPKNLNFILTITDMFGNNIKALITLQENNSGKRDEFLNVLSNEIIKIRKQNDDLEQIKKEQNDFKNEIEQLKQMI